MGAELVKMKKNLCYVDDHAGALGVKNEQDRKVQEILYKRIFDGT